MKIGFIGLGNMAQAMIGGVLRNHLAVPEEIYGSAKTAETESKVHEMFGITVTGDNLETARQAELLILAVKPQFLEKVIGQISDIDLTGKTILSIAAGKSLAGRAVLRAASVCACDAQYAGTGRGRLYRSLLWQQGNS